MLGCSGLFLRCTSLEKTDHSTGIATDVTDRPFADFVEQSRPKKLDYRPLYVDGERRTHRSEISPPEKAKTFKDLEHDLERQLNGVHNTQDVSH
jgi:hypothetical protein